MEYEWQGFYIPNRMMGGIQRYISNNIRPGGFLSAVIQNDLREAVARADDENLRNLPAYVAYFWNNAPSLCWGSAKAMDRWLKGESK